VAALGICFLLEAILCLRGDLRVELAGNALLAAVVAFGARRWRREPGWVRAAMALLAAACGGVLLWRESFLPPLFDSLQFLADPAQRPTMGYIGKFLRGLLNPAYLPAAAAAAGLGWAVRRRPRTAALAGAAALLAAWAASERPDAAALSRTVKDFYAAEAGRRVAFPARAPRPAFDLIILHVCSLSNADLRAAGLDAEPFWRQFDLVFDRFETVTTYSAQAVPRLLRSPCGQARYEDLLPPPSPECGLAARLRAAGFELDTALNHDGRYQNLLSSLLQQGWTTPPARNSGLAPVQRGVDGSAVYDDGEVLGRWLRSRPAGGKPRALYYNTVTLHTGNAWAGPTRAGRESQAEHYRAAAAELFRGVSELLRGLRRSGRDAVVLFVPEHGANLGERFLQAPGLRDLPLPDITTVPVGVALIRGGASGGPPARDGRPVSYLALAELLSRFIERPPFGPTGAASALASLPETRPVAENRRSYVLEVDGKLYLGWKIGKWTRLRR
jgi:cellulose synthase operon protein YhjU